MVHLSSCSDARPRCRAPRFAIAGCLLAALATACTDPQAMPTAATVIVEANPTEPLALIASADFSVADDGTTLLNSADTIEITGNYNREFRMDDPARFTAILRNDSEEEDASARLSVLIDGRNEYDEIAILGTGGFLQFVYRFNAFGGGT